MKPTTLPSVDEGAPLLDSFTPEVAAGIRQLNVNPANSRFMKLVDDLLRPESLPRGWTATFDAAEGKWWYNDKAGQLHDKHPVYDYYIGAMFMDLGGYAQLKRFAAERPPTAEEVQQMGLYLGMKQDEDPYIWQVAEMALCAPLPPSWQETVSEVEGRPTVMFMHAESGQMQQEHPLDNYFLELMRRRRLELLRKKKAALKTLQALIKMGMGRRSQLTSLAAAAGNSSGAGGAKPAAPAGDDQEEHEDVETIDPSAQTALLSAWQGLLGTTVHLLDSLKAAQWDGGLSNISSSSSNSGDGAPTAPPDHAAATLPWVSSTAVKAALGAAAPAAPAALQQRLSQLSATLSSALLPNAAAAAAAAAAANITTSSGSGSPNPEAAAAAALEEIEALAMQTTAAGNDADALMRVLDGQGITLPDFCEQASPGSGSRTMDQPSSASSLQVCGSAGESSSHHQLPNTQCSQRSERRPSIAGHNTNESAAWGSAVQVGGMQRHSLLQGKQVAFLASDAGVGAAASYGGTSSSVSRSSCGIGFVACSVGSSHDGSTAEDCCLSGSKPGAAGIASAASVRALAALWHDSDGKDEAADAAAAAAGGSSPATAGGKGAGAAEPAAAAAAAEGDAVPAANLGQQQQKQPIASVSAGTVRPGSPDSGAGSSGKSPASADDAQDMWSLFVTSVCPPMAATALQHMAALQAVLSEAAKLIHSWQQQRVIIDLLQQRLKAATVQVCTGQQRLAAAMQELQHIKDAQAQSSSCAAAASWEYQELLLQFQQVHQQLEQVQSERQQLHQGSTQLQASLESALAAAATANDKQQQLEQQLHQLQQELEQDQAAKAAQQLQLDQALGELAHLQTEHAKSQADAGSGVAASATELCQLQALHRELQAEHEKLQGSLAAAEAAAASSRDQQHLLKQQQLLTQQQLQELQAAHAALQAQYQQQERQLGESQQAVSQLQAVHRQQQAQLAATQQQLHSLQAEQQDAQQRQQQLQAEHWQLLDRMTGEQQQAAEHQVQLQSENNKQQEALQQLVAHKQQLEQQRQQLAADGKQQKEQLANAQQQLQQLQAEMQQAQQQQQQLVMEKESLLEQQLQLLVKHEQAAARAKAAQQEVADMQAAARAAEEQQLAMPRRTTQVSATDHIEQGWVHTRGVQTGEELDPHCKKDVGTPADLALISYFFRDIKHKQRGGGGALVGYDPQAALAAAATAVPAGSAKSWTGAAVLPPISQSGSGECSWAKRRPVTMPGSLRPTGPWQSVLPAMPAPKKAPESEEDTGGFDTRPAPFEVKQRVDRRRDRAMKLEVEQGEEAAEHDRWDYNQDERDNEIAELKKRLVEEQRKSKEAASKAETDLKEVMSTLQASKHSMEQLQAENSTLRKEVDSLKIGLQAMDVTSTYRASSAAGAGALLSLAGAGALRPSVFAGGLSANKALGGRTSATGFVGGPSPGGSLWGSGLGGSGAMAGPRASVALLSLGGAPDGAAAGLTAGLGLPAAAGALAASAGSSVGGSISSSSGMANASGSKGAIMAAGRASVMGSQQKQSPYAAQVAKGLQGHRAASAARKPQVALDCGAVEADTAVSSAP